MEKMIELPKPEQTTKKHKCYLCDKVFYGSSRDLRDHIKSVHEGVKDHDCESCEKSFTTRRHLLSHFKKVHGQKRFQCDACWKFFGVKYYFLRYTV